MRSILTTSAFAILILAACSSDEPPTQPEAEDTVTEPVAEVTPPPAGQEEAEDARPQAVEESGGEPDEAEAEEKQIVLAPAKADSTQNTREWKYHEGKEFHRLVPTQPTLGGADKVEVAEFFWYGCAHCYEFENYINPWEETVPANARVVRIPATWNALVKLHAQLYYTEEVLVKNGKIADPKGFRAAVFNEYHRRGNRLTSMDSIKALFARYNVSEDDFDKTWSSFEVAQKLRVAQDLSQRYAISGVPAMVVNGKYRTGKAEAGTYPVLLDVVDELVEREAIR